MQKSTQLKTVTEIDYIYAFFSLFKFKENFISTNLILLVLMMDTRAFLCHRAAVIL